MLQDIPVEVEAAAAAAVVRSLSCKVVAVEGESVSQSFLIRHFVK